MVRPALRADGSANADGRGRQPSGGIVSGPGGRAQPLSVLLFAQRGSDPRASASARRRTLSERLSGYRPSLATYDGTSRVRRCRGDGTADLGWARRSMSRSKPFSSDEAPNAHTAAASP